MQNFGLISCIATKALTSNSGLDRLPSVADAPFNSYNKQHAPTCLPDTRVDLLQEIHDWADGQDEQRIFWLNGLAGTGKSTIACTVAQRYFDQRRLGASFFFSRGGGDVSHAGKFVASIAVQAAYQLCKGPFATLFQRTPTSIAEVYETSRISSSCARSAI